MINENEVLLEGVESADAVEIDSADDDANHPVLPLVTEVPSIPISTFAEAGVSSEVIAAVEKIGWATPTPVQCMCLPLTLKGVDVAGFAQTGTGKTGVFVITIAEKLSKTPAPERPRAAVGMPEVLVLTPTRELALQIEDDAQKVLGPLGIKSIAIFGGVDLEKQAGAFKAGPRVLVATPGRLKDLFQRKMVDLSQVSTFICDEADRMFDMGFIDDVEFFLDKTPENSQKLLFSATTNDHVKELAFEYLNQPAYISVNPEILTPELIEQHAVICDSSNKLRVMLGLMRDHQPVCSIVFTNTKMTAEWLHFKLNGNGIDADLITGDLPQKKRIDLIHRIKEGKVKALIATDVASRGLHISKVSHVYNFDVPDDPANYIHRIGRTARAGAKGSSYTLVCEDYGENIRPIQEMLESTVQLKGEWFDSSYLAIEDRAGNPYAAGGALYRDPRDRASKPGGRPGATQGRSTTSPRDNRDRPIITRPVQSSASPKAQSSSSPKAQVKVRNDIPRVQGRKVDVQSNVATQPIVYRAEGTPIGLVGWLVKVFKVFFGMKSK